ncbi:subtilisin-like protein [Ramicandelaber brevisporus]|nr:subtilisin-like protein [Ramicandelaber brevisporus]
MRAVLQPARTPVVPRSSSASSLLHLLLLLVFIIYSFSLISLASATAGLFDDDPRDTRPVVPGRFIIEYESASADPFDIKAADNSGIPRTMMRAGIREPYSVLLERHGIKARVHQQFSSVFNGMAVEVTDDASMASIASKPGIKRVRRSRLIGLPSFEAAAVNVAQRAGEQQQQQQRSPIAQQMANVHSMTGVLEARARFGVDGRGVRVGIVDSGVDYTHPALGGCFGTSGACKVTHGWDFVGDNYRSITAGPLTSSSRDTFGHGTHVAGILAANDAEVTGVSPGVTLGAYRVYDSSGQGPDDLVIAALEMAVRDGNTIINLSLGSGVTYPDDPLSLAVQQVINRGIIVTISAGNYGTLGLFSSAVPAAVKNAISVGSIDNGVRIAYKFTSNVTGSDPLEHSGLINPAPSSSNFSVSMGNVKDAQLIQVQTTTTPNCTLQTNSTLLANRAALMNLTVTPSACSDKLLAAVIKANPAAVLLYGPPDNPNIRTENSNISLPVVQISASLANRFLSYDNNGTLPVAITGSSGLQVFQTGTSGQVSSTSSRGPTDTLELKPSVLAPGGYIYSTLPLRMGMYGQKSGTSMSAPYIAGCIALLIQRLQFQLSNVQVLAALQNTARRQLPSHLPRGAASPAASRFFSPAEIGAGLVNAADLLGALAVMMPSQISLNDTARPTFFGMYMMPLQIRNYGSAATSYTFTHEAAGTASVLDDQAQVPTVTPNYSDAPANVVILPSMVSLAPGATATVLAMITPPKVTAQQKRTLPIYGGWISATPSDAQIPAVRTVYMGVAGDFGATNVFYDPPKDVGGPQALTAQRFAPRFFSTNSQNASSDPSSLTVDPYSGTTAIFSIKQIFNSRNVQATLVNEDGSDIAALGADGGRRFVYYASPSLRSSWDDPASGRLDVSVIDYACTSGIWLSEDRCSPASGMHIPNGNYKIKVSGLRPYGQPGKASDYQTLFSPVFRLQSSRPR